MEPNLTPISPSLRKPSRNALFLFFLLTAMESLGGAAYLLSIPADPKNAVCLGYSVSRWVGVLGFGLLFFVSGCLAVKAYQNRPFIRIVSLWDSPEKMKMLLGIAYAVILMSSSVLLLPGYRVGSSAAVLVRLRPFLLWSFLVSLQILLWGVISKFPYSLLREKRSQSMSGLRPLILPVSILGACWAFIAFTKLGLKPDTMFWNGSAVPLLLWQVIGGLFIGFLFYQFEHRFQWAHSDPVPARHKMFDLAVCLVLWFSAVFIWQLIPQRDSYFAPGPYPPNNEFYPYSDAATYDLNAEFAVIGQGLAEQEYVDKPFYSWILFILHQLSGDKYSFFMFLHVVLIAAIVPVMYLIGWKIHSRSAGIAMAVVVLLYETNAIIATPWINAPNAKLLLTEPACRLGLALFTLWFIQASRDQARRNLFLAAAGGVLGLTTMIRYNAWFILPVAMIWILLTLKKNWKRSLIHLVIFVVAFLLPLLPWMFHTSQTWVTPYFFATRFRGTVWMERYAPDIVEADVIPDFTPASPLLPTDPALIVPTKMPIPQTTNEPVKALPADSTASRYKNPVAAILNLSSQHFLHNLVTSVLGLPESLLLHDVEHTIRIPNSHWLPGWDQQLNLRQILFLALNLTLMGMGINLSVKDRKSGGWIPLIVYLTYNAGLAFARTSGGRYLTPIEWIPLMYYLLGWIEIFLLGKKVFSQQPDFQSSPPLFEAHPVQQWRKVVLVIAGIFVIGLAIPWSDRIIPNHNLPEKTIDVKEIFNEEIETEQISQVQVALDRFMKNENAVMLAGKGLYPRYYLDGEGEAGIQRNTQAMPFSRLTFTLIGKDFKTDVLFSIEKLPEYFPHGATVTVIGCDDGDYLDAMLVIIETENGTKFYRRTPLNKLMCPLDEPSRHSR